MNRERILAAGGDSCPEISDRPRWHFEIGEGQKVRFPSGELAADQKPYLSS
jgi:hypothetical protein